MNALQNYLGENNVDETKAMNILQEHGIISDNCVTAADVPDCDAEDAIDFLQFSA